MRIPYSDDEQYSGQFALYRSNVSRCLLGKKGQAALRRLRAAILALPKKRLIANAVAQDGEVCAIGAALVYESVDRDATLKDLELEFDEYEDTAKYAPKDFPYMMAWAVVEANDFGSSHLTPERRYEHMLAWIDARLAGTKLPLW